jgi:hypothetical protein
MKKHILAFVLFFSIPSVAMANILIDPFNSMPNYFSMNSSGTRTDTGLANVLGGSRSIVYHQYGDVGFGQNLGFYDQFSCNNGPSNWSDFLLTYDKNGTGLNTDFSSDVAISVTWHPDHTGFGKSNIMSVTMTDMDNQGYTSSIVWNPPYVLGQADRVTSFLLLDYANNGVNLARVKSISLYYEGDWANDAGFKSFGGVVPEPATVSLLLMGMSALGTLSRRRLSAKV